MEFKKVKRNVTVGHTPGVKYMAQIVRGETIDFNKMADMIAETSTISKGDILAVLEQMQTTAAWMMQAGHSVRFGDLGIFTPTAKVKAVDTEEKVTVETIQRMYTRFTPSVDLKQKMKSSKIVWKE
ncbi:MAG: HU family DNA-binding protein [Bacteroidales bacterium]|jgi:predicted histone-like DNA-binding protein|nr:HU family DNA-binding protein [Bacteroidales bacterium]